ncbi:hypothetical protein ACIA8K_12485 [Catenuloplanes sp. NPDC051500]|uniref:hypothetical protein n=1 Tax=Catenuloplanes sp. NPDC051500 TaxID=3363959 RepID=UPI0037951B0B
MTTTPRLLILPGQPGAKLRAAFEQMDRDERSAFLDHLLADTPAEWLSDLLTRHGTPVSASTIRSYRRSLPPEARQ